MFTFDIEVHGAEDLILRLRNLAERVPETGRKTMHRGADKIVEEAQLNTPVDKHNLEKSIRKEISYSDTGSGSQGRLQIDIVVGGTVNGVDVDEYSVEVHERYEDFKGVGKGTQAKREANPSRYIGEKFLTRAFEAQRKKLMKAMIDAVEEEWEL